MVSEATGTVTIVVGDVNDNSPQFEHTSYSTSIPEDMSTNTNVLTVSATDADSGTNKEIVYEIAGSFVGPFAIDSFSGDINVSSELGNPKDYLFYVIARDAASFSLSATSIVHISVYRKAAITPLFDSDQYIFSISELFTGNESIVGTLKAITQGNMSIEGVANFRVKPSIYPSIPLFAVNETSGAVSVVPPTWFDYENQSTHIFYAELYSITNTSMIFDIVPVLVTVIDQNDNSPFFSEEMYSVAVHESTSTGTAIITVSATDLDSGSNSNVQYSLQSNVIGFHIEKYTGIVTVTNSTLIPGFYVMNVVATDSGEMPNAASVNLSVTVLSETLLVFSSQAYSFSATENSPINTIVGMVSVTGIASSTNVDSNDIVFGQLLPPYNCLSISSKMGEISVSCSALDREKQSLYQVVVTAMNLSYNISGEVTVSVIVEDENDNPPIFDQNVYAVLVTTSHDITSSIVQVSATDEDDESYAQFNYVIVNDTMASALFNIKSTGEIFFTETSIPVGDYLLTIQAIDANNASLKSTSLVHVSVVDSTPKALMFSSESQNLSIVENSPPGSTIGVLQLLAPNPINPTDYAGLLEFEIIGGEKDFFHVTSDTGSLLLLNNFLDRETKETYIVYVQASFHTYNVSANANVTINVLDQNDNAPGFVMDIYATTINDSLEIGTVVLMVDAVDIDAGSNQEVSYFLESGSSFEVDSTSGAVMVKSALDPGHYTLTVMAVDAGMPQQTGTAQISIIIDHSLPSFISFSQPVYSASIQENELAGTYITTVSISEESPALEGLVYSLNDTVNFHIDPSSGNVSTFLPLDYEKNKTVMLTADAKHPSGLMASAQVQITVTDVNDNKPIFKMSLYTANIIQGSTAVVLMVHASDADSGPSGMVKYSILSDESGFLVDMESGYVSASSSVTLGTHTFTITATDKGSPPLSSTTLVVIGVYLATPTSIQFTESMYEFELLENVDPGTEIVGIALQTYDSTNATSQEYVSSEPTLFQISSAGNLILTSPLDYEAKQSISFTVTATVEFSILSNASSLSATASVTVLVIDVNDNSPVFVNLPASNVYVQSILEHSSEGTSIVTVMVDDADSDSITTLSYQLDNTFGGRFAVTSLGAVVTGGTEIDRETDQSFYTFSVLVSDGGSHPRTSSAMVQVTVIDKNDNAPVLHSGDHIYIAEKQKAGTVVSTIVAADADEGSNAEIRYELVDQTSVDTFSIPDPDSGNLIVVREIDYEPDITYTIHVKISDKGSPPMSNTVIIDIEIIDLPNDARPSFLGEPYKTNILPNLMNGDFVFKVTATDEDADLISYSILPGTHSVSFAIDNSGIVRKELDVILDPGSYIYLSIQAQDDSQLQLTSTAILTICIYEQSSFTMHNVTVDIAEDVLVGKSIQTLQLIDTSLTEQTNFTLKGEDSSSFEIEVRQEEIILKVKLELDREARSEPYSFTVVAQTEGYSVNSMATVTVIVTDINDNSPSFTDSDKRFTAQVSDPPATRLGRVNATDPDQGSNGSVVFSLGDDSVPFSIDATSGVLSVEDLLDAYDSEIAVVVIATDQGPEPMSAQETYTVHVEQSSQQTLSVPMVIGLGVVILILVLVIVGLVVYVFARRQHRQPRKRTGKDTDLYKDWELKNPSKNRTNQSEMKMKESDDLTYEVMFEDEDYMGLQTMPWSNPNYQADAHSRQSETFDESSQTMTPDMESLDRESGLATMPDSGNSSSIIEPTRKGRRISADESSTSDITYTDYLSSYQQTTPLKQGEKPSEYGLLLGHNFEDKPPARPSLKEYIWPHGAPSSKNKFSWPPS